MPCLILLLLAAMVLPAAPSFRIEEIGSRLTVVYAVTTADMNGDRRPDVVAVLSKKVVWFENPGRAGAPWTPHTVLDRPEEKDNVCLAVEDIDRDGRPDIALGASWQPTNTESGGTLQWLRNTGKDEIWPLYPIAEEPTLHRIRWGDVDGDGRKELVVAPLHGRGNKGPAWEGAGLRLLVFRVPAKPASEPWPVEVADSTLHIGHNLIVEDFDGDAKADIWLAAREGVHVFSRSKQGGWSRARIGDGPAGEIKLGRVAGKRVMGTVEPWHGNGLVIYEEPKPRTAPGVMWPSRLIEERLASGHALGWADFDADGNDDLVVGWREKAFGLALYQRQANGDWTRQPLDDGMATEDLTTADLNGDGKADIVAGGRSTSNLRIYWNTTPD